MMKKPSAQEFLAKLNQTATDEGVSPPRTEVTPSPEPVEPAVSQNAKATVHKLPKAAAKPKQGNRPSRAALKHFGGYLHEETFEKIALLRHRLKKDNSELIELAVDELFRRHNAKRAFGDM